MEPEPVAERTVVGFAHAVRRAGLAVPTGATVVFGRALAAVGMDRPSRVYWAGRASFVRSPDDVVLYDQAFADFFGLRSSPATAPETVTQQVDLALDAEGEGGLDANDEPSREAQALRWSPTEILRHKDLATCTSDEIDEAHRLISFLGVHSVLRRHRRRQRCRHGRGRPDLRTSMRQAMRTGGEVLRPAVTRPGEQPRRLVLLLDVSGSMEPYARALARFAHAAVTARRRGHVEVFALGTRVTRVTRELSSHDPDDALAQASDAVEDWAGGTRLGEGLRRFNDRWGVRGLARGAVVVILSDGWDRGDPEVLAQEAARLHRVAHRLVWVNPLKASPGYAPLARGMAAALPHVDEFVEGHSVASLEKLAEVVAR